MLSAEISDSTLMQYIDQIFDKYDFDRCGSLNPEDYSFFFNDLLESIGDPRRITN
jgi:hypothetical protein